MPDFSLRELAEIVGGRLNFGTMPPVDGDGLSMGRIVTDSRQVTPDDVFWALAGSRHNGAHFVDEAFERGATGVVVARRDVEPWAGRWSLRLDDAEWGLWQLAEATRCRFAGQVIAVAGSVGKTDTRQMIDAVVGSRLRGAASTHSDDHHQSVVLNIVAWSEEHEYAVLELDARKRDAARAVARLSAPHIGVITDAGDANVSNFDGEQTHVQSSEELLEAISSDGWAVLNRDDRALCRLADRCRARIVWVGRSAEADLVATDVRNGDERLRFRVDGHEFCVTVWGQHDLTSSLSVIAVGQVMELSMDEIATALAKFQPAPDATMQSTI